MGEKIFEPGSVNYDSDIASNYPAARAFSADTADTWATALYPFITRSSSPTVLDLGCGTGRFASLVAERFAARVIGLDLSIGMLQAARRGLARSNPVYAAARGDYLPLADSSCDLAWLSQVIHHIPDRVACARELRRVVRPDGYVLIRGAFGDRLDGFPAFFRFFPGARRIAGQFPTLSQVTASFQTAGFSIESLQRVQQKTCDSLGELAERTRLRADSTLLLLPDSEFEHCQAALEQAASSEDGRSPVIETLDLLVLRVAT
ncbi:MAG: class I SAM-dependent methyltransferase [Acidobacteriota bacterium]